MRLRDRINRLTFATIERDALARAVEFVDEHLLRHRFQRVCHLGWWLYNGAPEGDVVIQEGGDS